MASKAKGSRSKTEEIAKKLALAVIREHGLPPEIQEELLAADVPPEVIERIGGYHYNAPHGAWGYSKHKHKDKDKDKDKGKGQGNKKKK